MTDNEIIKALECVASDKDVLCKGCSYNKYYLNQCHKENAKDAIDLINRQKAEIERLKKEIENLESMREISPEVEHFVDTKADKVISLLNEVKSKSKSKQSKSLRRG